MIYSFCSSEVIGTISHFVGKNYFCYIYFVAGLSDDLVTTGNSIYLCAYFKKVVSRAQSIDWVLLLQSSKYPNKEINQMTPSSNELQNGTNGYW